MADTKISGLASGTPAWSTDVFPIERAGTSNFRLTLSDVFNLAGGYVNDPYTSAPYSFPSLSIKQTGTSSGYLGIGTNAPSAALDILGTTGAQIRSTATAQLRIAGTSGVPGTSSLDITHTSTSADIINRTAAPLNIGTYGSSDVNVKTNNITRLTIAADGSTLTFNGVSTADTTFNLGSSNVSTGSVALQIGQGRTGSGNAYIDLVGDTTYSDYGLRIGRSNTGANADSGMIHRGTGELIFNTQDTAQISLQIAGTTKFYVNTDGYSYAVTPTTGDNTTKVATTAFVQNSTLGNIPSWAAPGYTAGNTYTNTYGKPIAVFVSLFYTAGAGDAHMQIDGRNVNETSTGNAVNLRVTLYGIVPPGKTYRVDGTNISTSIWLELR